MFIKINGHVFLSNFLFQTSMNVKIPHMTVNKNVSILWEATHVNVLPGTEKILQEHVRVCL